MKMEEIVKEVIEKKTTDERRFNYTIYLKLTLKALQGLITYH
jgi:hypothetical protein